MQLIDTHNHIYLPEFDSDRDAVIERAVAAGVTSILLPNIDSNSVAPMMEAAERYKDLCFPMAGLHPTSVNEDYKKEIEIIRQMLNENSFCGIGETGIDLYWDKTHVNEQIIAFREHLTMAEETKLPIVIHARESLELIFKELNSFGAGRITGVFHAFPGNEADARRVVDMGFMIGIGGVVTFRNSFASEAALAAGLDNIVLETDAPYLTPAPHRGKRNESAYLTIIAGKLAELFSVETEEIGRITSSNARRIFKIK